MTNEEFTRPPVNESEKNQQSKQDASEAPGDQKGLSEQDEEAIDSGEITNNDGSVVETLDTAFHNEPGYISHHSPAGSNRAEYYEERSGGKSDSDEELEYLRQQSGDNKPNDQQ